MLGLDARQLDSKVVVVFDGAPAIGRAITSASLRHGARVAIASSSPAIELEANLGPSAGRWLQVTATSRREEDVDQVFDFVADAFGRIDVVVVIVPATELAAQTSSESDVWDDVIEARLTSVFLVARRAVQEFLGQGESGRIVVVSVSSSVAPEARAAMAAGDAGIIGLIRTITKEYGRRSVYANAVSVEHAGHAFPNAAEPTRAAIDQVATAVVFLASERASFINGERVALTVAHPVALGVTSARRSGQPRSA